MSRSEEIEDIDGEDESCGSAFSFVGLFSAARARVMRREGGGGVPSSDTFSSLFVSSVWSVVLSLCSRPTPFEMSRLLSPSGSLSSSSGCRSLGSA